MWFACLNASGLFFVHVGDQLAARGGDRTRDVGARHQDRKVTDVRRVFLLEVNMQAIGRNQPIGERRPSPVLLPLHDSEQRFLEIVSIHAQHTLAPQHDAKRQTRAQSAAYPRAASPLRAEGSNEGNEDEASWLPGRQLPISPLSRRSVRSVALSG